MSCKNSAYSIYIYIYPDTLFCILRVLKVLHPKSSWGVSILGNESWLNSGTCIRLMLNSSVLHGPASGAAHVGQSVVSDYGLLHAWLFPLLAMAIPPTTSIPSCRMFWNPLYFYKNMGKAVFCHGWHRISAQTTGSSRLAIALAAYDPSEAEVWSSEPHSSRWEYALHYS